MTNKKVEDNNESSKTGIMSSPESICEYLYNYEKSITGQEAENSVFITTKDILFKKMKVTFSIENPEEFYEKIKETDAFKGIRHSRPYFRPPVEQTEERVEELVRESRTPKSGDFWEEVFEKEVFGKDFNKSFDNLGLDFEAAPEGGNEEFKQIRKELGETMIEYHNLEARYHEGLAVHNRKMAELYKRLYT